ncbi:MAG: MOSC domain-containing protein [Rhodobacter sp.]|nr:MOSC domain-containing protein [Paracoccaceae bacterium]MCB1411123.1 MOSC domain-containing protein [Paracoccaceae bacterium]MCC0080447.1 MOSC domain-containing protein [Rhodobacter sp.]
MSAAHLAHIVRHPVKSAGFQALTRAALNEGRPFPFDRHYAIATEAAKFGTAPEGWVPKMNFVRGAAEGSLQAIRADFDETTGAVHLTHPRRPSFSGTLPDDGDALIAWLRPLWPADRPAPRALVARRDGGALTDVPGPWISVLNLASLRMLGARMGLDLSIHRFRGNLWLDGLPEWSEFDLIGREIAIGSARLRIEQRITRCVATTYDPETAAPEGDTLAALESGWGHRDLGVYATVTRGGEIALGDPVEILP